MSNTITTPRPDFAGILREQESFGVVGDESLGNRLNGAFDRLMVQSGTGLAPSTILSLSLISTLAVGGLVFVLQENPLTTAIGTVIGAISPTLICIVLRVLRQRKMNQQLPAMIDELSRAAKTGRSLESCLTLVAADTPTPLGRELQYCTRKLALGVNVEQALRELPERTGLVGARVLATACSVHRRTGGDLVKVLERLSRTLRDRLQFQARLRAATAASRATAGLMVILPLVIVAFFMFRDPDYLSTLFASPWGAKITVAALVLEAIGGAWVHQILKQSQRA